MISIALRKDKAAFIIYNLKTPIFLKSQLYHNPNPRPHPHDIQMPSLLTCCLTLVRLSGMGGAPGMGGAALLGPAPSTATSAARANLLVSFL